VPQPSNRPDLFVVVRVLETLRRNPSGLRKTPLQLAAGTNYTVFSRYLERLLERGLVRMGTQTEGTDVVILTPKGSETLQFLVRGIERVVRDTSEP
jgi:predicted transcriptional regulator